MSIAGFAGLVVLVIGVIAVVVTWWLEWLLGDSREITLSKTSEKIIRRT